MNHQSQVMKLFQRLKKNCRMLLSTVLLAATRHQLTIMKSILELLHGLTVKRDLVLSALVRVVKSTKIVLNTQIDYLILRDRLKIFHAYLTAAAISSTTTKE